MEKTETQLRKEERNGVAKKVKTFSPIAVMKQFYNGADVAFKVKSEAEWFLTARPLWNWGACDYKVIDIDSDDYFW